MSIPVCILMPAQWDSEQAASGVDHAGAGRETHGWWKQGVAPPLTPNHTLAGHLQGLDGYHVCRRGLPGGEWGVPEMCEMWPVSEPGERTQIHPHPMPPPREPLRPHRLQG